MSYNTMIKHSIKWSPRLTGGPVEPVEPGLYSGARKARLLFHGSTR
jgi:hypothetical protein